MFSTPSRASTMAKPADSIHGRGAADMKTVVATYLVWMKDAMKAGAPYPNIALLLVGNEENGEAMVFGIPKRIDNLRGVVGSNEFAIFFCFCGFVR